MVASGKRNIFLFYILIVALNVLIYFPSLEHIPRSDHFAYLGNTAHEHDWKTLALSHYAINREKVNFGISFSPLFRPLVFFMLGNERYLFGYQFMYWQATGIFLHMLVLWWLLNILWRIHPGQWAAITCLFFSVLLANAELVTWQHVHGYLLYILFMLMALHQVLIFRQTKTLTRSILLKLFFSLLLACFSHESGSVFCLLFSIYFLAATRQYFPSIMIASPCFIYFAATLIDLHSRGLSPAESVQLFQPVNILYGLLMSPIALFWWAFIGLFPTLTFTEFAQRTFMYPVFIHIEGYTFEPRLSLLFPAFFGLGLMILYVIYMRKYLTSSFIKKSLMIWMLLFSMLFSFAFLVCFGRAAVRGFQRIMVENGAYNYFFWIFFIILIYLSIPFDRLKQLKQPVIKILFFSLMAVLILLNAYGVFRLNAQRNIQSYPQASLFREITGLIKAHGAEHDFSFVVHPGSQNHLVKYRKRTDPSQRPCNSAELLYPQYYDHTHPKYVFRYAEHAGWRSEKQF